MDFGSSWAQSFLKKFVKKKYVWMYSKNGESRMKIMFERSLTDKEMADKLGISTVKLYRMVSEGMPHFKVGSHYRFFESKVLAYLEDKK